MGKHLFFIDDDDIFLHILERTCRKIDEVSQFSSACHGRDALNKIDTWVKNGENIPNIAFVDINMPIMNGLEFLEHFKKKREQIERLKQIIPIVMLTSSEDGGDKEKAFATGIVDDYMVKPFHIKEMETFLRKVIL